MVRYKKRYFVFQIDRHSDIAANYRTSSSKTNQAKKQKLSNNHVKRALVDPKPLGRNTFLADLIKLIISIASYSLFRYSTGRSSQRYCNPDSWRLWQILGHCWYKKFRYVSKTDCYQ